MGKDARVKNSYLGSFAAVVKFLQLGAEDEERGRGPPQRDPQQSCSNNGGRETDDGHKQNFTLSVAQ